jgi:hypothetical protein
MALFRGIKRNFTGGEVAPTVEARDDMAKFQSSCRRMRNFVAQLHGGARYRGGWHYCASMDTTPAWALKFVFNTDPEDAYEIILTDGYITIAQGDGFVLDGGSPVQLVSPYTVEDAMYIDTAQSGDVIYLAHRDYPPHKLVRNSHTDWELVEIDWETNIDPPTNPTGTWDGATGKTFTQRYQICSVSEKGEVSLPSDTIEVTDCADSSGWVAGDHIDLSWDEVADAQEYNIYKEDAGLYGLIGVSSDLTFIDNNYAASSSEGPQVAYDPFDSVGNYPSTVTLHQQRVVWGGTIEEPQTVFGTQVASYENMNKTRPVQADSSYKHTVVGPNINAIQWLTSFGDLMIGTAGAEHKMFATSGGAIAPTDVDAEAQSFWGSDRLDPLIIGNSVLHVQNKRSAVRDLFYSLEKDGYAGNNLSVLADHFFDGYEIVDWDYQQKPDSVVWAVRNDGKLLGMSYLKEHEIWGWHLHETDGEFKSVVCVPGADENLVYAIIAREIGGETRYYLERYAGKWRERDGIENAFFVDSGLSTEALPITAATQASPVQLTVTGHGMTTGDTVLLENVGGMTELNDTEAVVTVVDADTVTLDGVDGTAYTAYTSGGDLWVAKLEVSGLDHLEGKEVVALTDGSPLEGLTVTDGSVTLGTAAYRIHVGLPYVGVLAPLTFEGEDQVGTTQGRERGPGSIKAYVHQSVGGETGLLKGKEDLPEKLYAIKTQPDNWDEAVPPYTGYVDLPIGGGFSPQATICVVQRQPLPLEVQSIVGGMSYGG